MTKQWSDLKQLDRIEFLLLDDGITKSHYSFANAVNSMVYYAFMMLFFVSFALLYYIAFDDSQLLLVILRLSKDTIKPVLILVTGYWIFSMFHKAKRMKKLKGRYGLDG